MTFTTKSDPISGGNRRGFLKALVAGGTAALAAACAPAAPAPALAPAAPAAAPAGQAGPAGWQQEWDDLIARAKGEGKLAVNWIHNQQSPRKALDQFEAAFRGITVELTTFASASLFNPKVIQELAAGINTWDVTLQGTPFGILLRDAGALEPIRPLIFHPDAMDSTKWYDGFDSGFEVERQKKWGYGFLLEVNGGQVWMNTDLVQQGEIQQVKDLLNPKWKGKFIFTDVRQGGTFVNANAIRLGQGEGVLKGIFIDQEPTYTREDRAVAEGLVRGRYAVGIGASVAEFLKEFRAQGLGQNVKTLVLRDLTYGSVSSVVWVLKKPPHPNALKLFLNWLLTKEGQTAYAQSSNNNSRRTDVAPVNPDQAVRPELKLQFTRGNEAMAEEEGKTQKLLLDLIR